MILFVCLSVCLVLGGLAFRHQIRAAFEDLWLQFFGVRVRVSARKAPAALDRRVATPSRLGLLPPVRVETRAGP